MEKINGNVVSNSERIVGRVRYLKIALFSIEKKIAFVPA